jgi:hypothetical protein
VQERGHPSRRGLEPDHQAVAGIETRIAPNVKIWNAHALERISPVIPTPYREYIHAARDATGAKAM